MKHVTQEQRTNGNTSVATETHMESGSETQIRPAMMEDDPVAWRPLYVDWTAVWIGALSTFAAMVVIGLIATAVGAHAVMPERRITTLNALTTGTLIFSVAGALLAAFLGGWITTRIADIRHSEPAMFHGAFSWLLTVVMLVALAGFGASGLLGAWFSGLNPSGVVASNSGLTEPAALLPNATPEEVTAYRAEVAEYRTAVKQWRDETPRVARNSALAAVTTLLLALIGSVLGGWFATGEPFEFTYYETRKPRYRLA